MISELEHKLVVENLENDVSEDDYQTLLVPHLMKFVSRNLLRLVLIMVHLLRPYSSHRSKLHLVVGLFQISHNHDLTIWDA